MSIRLASYNLWFHRAYPEVTKLANSQDLDILCLQECFTDELRAKAGKLTQAEAHTYTTNPPPIHPDPTRFSSGKVLVGNFGLALYYDKQRLRLEDATSYQLPLPWPERKGGRTLQLAQFSVVQTKQKLVIANVHLSSLWAHNRSRRHQMLVALEHIAQYRGQAPVIVAGDFNYPQASRGLRKLMAEHGFAECGIGDKNRTHLSRIVKGKFDRIFISAGLQEISYATLGFGASDHAPIMAEMEL